MELTLTKNQAAKLIKWHYLQTGRKDAQRVANTYLLKRFITVEQYIYLVKWTEGRAE
jgi:hypothetical protein